MLCVNCDQPLPDGADVCPSCGAHRLQLLVSPASEASLKPRRRHPVLKAMALLLCLGVVAALAGQAYLSHEGSSTPPKAKPKVKAPHKSTPTSSEPKSTTPTTTQEPEPPATVSVYLGRVPFAVNDRSAARDAAHAALREWGDAGVDVQEVEDSDAADVVLAFVADAADAEPSHSGLAVVPLGDAACGGEWGEYDAASITAIAARALGVAMGRDSPASLMQPGPPGYADGCSTTQGSLAVAGGQADGKPFRIEGTMQVAYTMQLASGYADACLLTPDEWSAFAAGEGGGKACAFASQSESDGAMLAPGDYILGFRCIEASATCQVDYTLSARSPFT